MDAESPAEWVASEDTPEDIFCWATLLTGRIVQDDEFDMVGTENDDDNGRVRTTLSTFLNPLCPAISCWKDGCFCAILYNCTELEIAKKHGDSWGVLMTHFDHGTWRFNQAQSLELLQPKIQHGRECVGANYAVTGRALHRARDCKETWGLSGCLGASFWWWYMKIQSSAIAWIAARTIQHGSECVGTNYAVTRQASNAKIVWCLDNTII